MYPEFVNERQNDALFKLVFGDYPENALSLYNAINKSNCTKEEIFRKERAKVANALYTALTDEEIERLRNYQMERAISEGIEQGIEQGVTRTKFEDVGRLVAEGTFDEKKACEILGVDIEEYRKHALR